MTQRTLAASYAAEVPHTLGIITAKVGVSSLTGGMVSEGIGIFFLITIPLNTALRCVACKFAPFAICHRLTDAFCIMSFGVVTAASINTARALGAGR
jgi:aquaporin Z